MRLNAEYPQNSFSLSQSPTLRVDLKGEVHIVVLKSLRTEVTILWKRMSFGLQVRRTGPSFTILAVWLWPSHFKPSFATLAVWLWPCHFPSVVPYSLWIQKILESQISVTGRGLPLDHKPHPPGLAAYNSLLPMTSLLFIHTSHSSSGFPAEGRVWIVWKRHMASQCIESPISGGNHCSFIWTEWHSLCKNNSWLKGEF